ncbi:hypothetical protein [Desulfonatronospira thiodismutans]|uniref:hypothetical protein n=1 Tax=Desulfonatronospira thiodismutans TaxID=488939 RepID=UPI00137642D3|nr:hypothetical protein [Desulfonatronospira thiodismutans]
MKPATLTQHSLFHLFACDETEIIKVSAGCFTGQAGGSAAHGWGVRLKSIPGGDCWHPLNGYDLDVRISASQQRDNQLQMNK